MRPADHYARSRAVEYIRHLQRIASGAAPLESILEVQDRYDNHFDESPAWQQALAARI